VTEFGSSSAPTLISILETAVSSVDTMCIDESNVMERNQQNGLDG